jgi:hypothetical protein
MVEDHPGEGASAVPLSENEQRQLEAIERALLADDPKFAAVLHGGGLRASSRRRLVAFSALVLIGAVLLCLTFVNIVFGLMGVVVMFLGVLGAIAAWRQLTGRTRPALNVADITGQRPPRSAGSKASSKVGWKTKMEQRWERRWDDRDF